MPSTRKFAIREQSPTGDFRALAGRRGPCILLTTRGNPGAGTTDDRPASRPDGKHKRSRPQGRNAVIKPQIFSTYCGKICGYP